IGRLSFAIAPSNQNIVYAMAAKSGNPARNSLYNIYLSEDKGKSWRIIAPGGSSSLNILGSEYWDLSAADYTTYYRGDYCNTLAVFPDDPYKILAGGINMWEGKKVVETGYYQWTEKSLGNVVNVDGSNLLFNGIYNGLYCHKNHHSYIFLPAYEDVFFVTTDGGIYLAGYSSAYNLYGFEAKNKDFNVTQFYSVDISNSVGEVLGGTQTMGTQYISGNVTTPKRGEDLWRPANLDGKYPEGTDGGFVALSNIRSKKDGEEEKMPASFYTKSPFPSNDDLINNSSGEYRMRRSESLGYDWSINFFTDLSTITNANFMTPITLWESYTNLNSRDSVYFKAEKDYSAGDSVTARSRNYKQPFHSILQEALSPGDSVKVQDIISSKLFFAHKDNVYMTLQGLRFDVAPDWFKISDKTHAGFTDNPSCMAYSSDCNYLFVGNYEGKIYRISNIALAYNQELADVGNTNCIIATTALEIYEGNSQVVTSISVDPKNANKVLVTLGNYGNTDYVFYSTNALSSEPVFESVQGDPGTTGLPLFPVYSSILEMQEDNDMAMVGTEEGIWVSDNVASGVWYPAGGSIGKVPVMNLKQQNVYKGDFVLTTYDPVTDLPIYEIFPGIDNYGMIYAATHGRGIFRNETYFTLGEDEHPDPLNSGKINLNMYPNPASGKVSIEFNLAEGSDMLISVFDLSGKQVYSLVKEGTGSGQQKILLDTRGWNMGSYIVQLVAGNMTGSARLIIVK
ncbi:MAG: T9SS type A sorting domain-containing protein, partial [Bacteroidetes bacterium]|nr:T9SS type A sorting domain-containing protein [Bacteroidota bacterium]